MQTPNLYVTALRKITPKWLKWIKTCWKKRRQIHKKILFFSYSDVTALLCMLQTESHKEKQKREDRRQDYRIKIDSTIMI